MSSANLFTAMLGTRQDLLQHRQKGPPRPPTPLPLRPPPLSSLLSSQPSTTTVTTTVYPETSLPSASDSAASSGPAVIPTLIAPPPPAKPPVATTQVSETSSEALVTDMPTFSTAFPTPTDSSHGTESSSGDVSGIGSNRALIITLSSVLSVVGLLLILGTLLLCWRFRQRRLRIFARGISPIDDDEIATWKVPQNEKFGQLGGDTDVGGEAAGAAAVTTAAVSRSRGSGDGPSHVKHVSTSSIKKPPSVIVYSNAQGQGVYRHSSDNDSPRSVAHSVAAPAEGHSRGMSFDKALPQTPIQARAPNARTGLTDESVPGDEPFLPSPKRHTSRLSKLPPGLSSSQRRAHVRTRSSRSSTRSFGDYASSELELSQRHSHDYIPRHHNIYSSSSIPPRLSFSDDSVFSGGLSPRPLLHDQEIGRAIG